MWMYVCIHMYVCTFTCTCIHEYTFKYIYGIHIEKIAYLIFLCLPILFTVLLSMEPGEKES